jgi:hypothetical protein
MILLAMSTMVRGAAAAAGGSPSWCICKPSASDAALQRTIDYARGNGADCSRTAPTPPTATSSPSPTTPPTAISPAPPPFPSRTQVRPVARHVSIRL